MAQQTLLKMVQNILSRMSSDEVNSIGDTTESLQVAQIIQNKYNDILDRAHLTKHQQLISLNPSNDPDKPVLMYVPDGISNIEWIKYFDTNILDGSTSSSQNFSHDLNVDLVSSLTASGVAPPGYLYVTILPIQQFLDMVHKFNPTDNDVLSFTLSDTSNNFPGDFTFYYKNDHQPRFCTILSNFYVIFDMYDNTQDDTLQESKTLCMGTVIPTFSMTDDFIPDLDDEQFPLLLNEATALAFFELKQTTHIKAEKEVNRQWSTVQKNKSVGNRPSTFDQLPSFGRRYSTGRYQLANNPNR